MLQNSYRLPRADVGLIELRAVDQRKGINLCTCHREGHDRSTDAESIGEFRYQWIFVYGINMGTADHAKPENGSTAIERLKEILPEKWDTHWP